MSKLDFLWKPSAAHPVHAARKAHKKDGNVMNAIFDPSGKIIKQPMTEKEGEEWLAKQRKKKTIKAYESIGRTPPGMKKGGKVKNRCRGMGKATKGGYFSHD